MSMTKTHFEDKQSQFSRLVDQIVVAIRSDDFKRWCLKVHNTVKYDELADNLSKYNQDMMGNKMNIVEWYLQCQQLNADIVANLLSSVAAHLTEEMTRVPIIKQLVYLIDQVVIAGLNCTHYVFQHTSYLRIKLLRVKTLPGYIIGIQITSSQVLMRSKMLSILLDKSMQPRMSLRPITKDYQHSALRF